VKYFLIFIFIFNLFSCASVPTKTQKQKKEEIISIELNGGISEVQNFIEEFVPKFYVKSVKDLKVLYSDKKSITFQTFCLNVVTQGKFKCAITMAMIGKGNSGWEGPYLTLIYNTKLEKNKTTITAEYKWCVNNLLGIANCAPNIISQSNSNLVDLKKNFKN